MGRKNQIFSSEGSPANTGIAGISLKLNMNGEISVAFPNEKSDDGGCCIIFILWMYWIGAIDQFGSGGLSHFLVTP